MITTFIVYGIYSLKNFKRSENGNKNENENENYIFL